MELDVGGDASVHCEVFPDGVDLANALRGRSTMRSNIESTQGKIDAPRSRAGTPAHTAPCRTSR